MSLESNSSKPPSFVKIKFDDDDGLVASLTENYADQCRVDYVEIIENGLILIEMKDLQSKILENFERRPTQEELVLVLFACKIS
jgi:hypothetical protein